MMTSYAFKDGKRVRIRKKFSAPTRGAVKEKLTNALKLQQDGYSVAPKNQTVGQFLNDWIENVVENSTKPKTASFYRYISEGHLIPSIGQIQLQKLTAQHVQLLLNEKLTCAKKKTWKKKSEAKKKASETEPAADVAPKLLSARSVRHIHRTLCTALALAVKHGAVQRNVAAMVEPPRAPKDK